MPLTTVLTNLVLDNRSFARAIARNVWKSLPKHVEFEEVQGFAELGLVQSATLFDPARGVAFRTFAYPRVRGAIFDGLARMQGVSKQVSAKQRENERLITREIAANDVCQQAHDDALGARDEEQRAVCLRATIRQLGMVFMLADAGEDNEARQAVDHGNPEADVEQAECIARLRQLVPLLPPDERLVIRMFYFESRTLTECAAKLGKHKSSVSRLHTRALARLREALAPSVTQVLPAA